MISNLKLKGKAIALGLFISVICAICGSSLALAQGNSTGKFRTALEIPSQDAPTCLKPASGLVITCYDGAVYFGLGPVAAGSSSGTQLTATDSMSSCPGTGECNFIYADTSGALHITTTLATAYTSTTSPIYFVDTTGGNIDSVQPVWRNTFNTAPAVGSNFGVATATSINGDTFTAGTYTLTGSAGKTLDFLKTLTLTGTDSTTITFPSTSATIARTDSAQTFTGTQTFGVIVGEKQPIIAVASTLSPTAAQSGSLILMGATGGEVITLPVPAVGLWYDVVITVTNTSNYNEIETDSGSTLLLGEVQHCATGIACLDFWANGTSTEAIKMDGAHLGGLIGSHFHLKAISSTQWEISGSNLGTATMTTAFTATP